MDNTTSSRNKLPTTILFPSKEGWGWRFRDLNTAANEPFKDDRPRPTMPELLDDLSFRKEQAKGLLGCILPIAVGVIFLTICGWAASTGLSQVVSSYTDTVSLNEIYITHVFLFLFMILAVLVAGAVIYGLIWHSHRAYRQNASKLPRNPQWIMQYAEDLRDYINGDNKWKKHQEKHDEGFDNKIKSLPEWGVLRPQRTTGRVDVYGGSPLVGWKALIVTLGASLLGSGSNLLILDLTQNAVADPLYHRSRQHGKNTWKLSLPEQQEHFNLLSNMLPLEVTDMLVEALHSDDKEDNKKDRFIDTRIIKGICQCLSQPLTIQTIYAGLLVLLRQVEGFILLGDEERTKIEALFQDEYRSQIRQQLVDLEIKLNELLQVGEQSNVQDDFSQSGYDLRIIELSKTGSTTLKDIFASLLIQRQIHLLQSLSQKERGTQVNVLMVAGVDNLKFKLLERLDDLCKDQGIRLIYLFRHLRSDALELLGGSDSTTVFMRLGNAKEAAMAAEFIGRGYKFVMNGYSENESVAVGANKGTSTESGQSLSGHSPWWADSWSNNFSKGTNESQSITVTQGTSRDYGRVYEFELEPTTLQNLDEMALLLVEKGLSDKGRPMQLGQNSGRQRVQIGYCDPDLLLRLRVSPDPLPNWEDGDR